MLIAFGGLPGTGKTTVARSLARKLSAVYLRIDSIEQALVNAGMSSEMGPTGYMVGYAIAADNLRIGLTVVADSVNPLTITRNAWRNVALEAGVRFFEVELICSDKEEHRSRIESRTTDIVGLKLPNWQNVLEREYNTWDSEHLIIDTAIVSVDQAIEKIIQNLPTTFPKI
jgi:predicted kinase